MLIIGSTQEAVSVDSIVLKPDVTHIESYGLKLSDTSGTVIENDASSIVKKKGKAEENKAEAPLVSDSMST